MKITGFLLLLAGWMIVLSALALLGPASARSGFVLAGVAIEALGLALVFRSHLMPREEGR